MNTDSESALKPQCVYNRTVSNIEITVAVYVDDLIITCSRNTLIDELTSALRTKCKEIKVVEGLIHNYLGMVLDFSQAPLVAINQTGFVAYVSTSPLLNPIAFSYNALSRPKSSSTLTPHSVFTPTTSLIQGCVPHSAEARSTPNLLFKSSSRHPHVKPNL